MIKKVRVGQLKPGMHIHDMNCGWMNHPFLTNSLKIGSDKTIEKIVDHGIRHVYIDTEKGLDVNDAPTKQEVDREIKKELDKIAEPKYTSGKQVSLEKEIVKAREIKKEAKKTVHDIMEDVRIGKPVKTEKVEKVVDKMIDSIFRNQDALISLGRIKKTDEYTFMHSMSVCVLMLSFGKNLGFNPKELKEVGVGAMLHDIGKTKVPLDILNSTSSFNDSQYEIMKKHVVYSKDILEETEGISELSIILASQHHERIDGRGYPDGLKGDEISLYGQAVAIVDVYDAMTSTRCYQSKTEPTEVLKKLYEWSNGYNADLVQQFIRCVGIYPVGSLVRLENGLLGIVIDKDNENLLQPIVRIVYDTKKARQVVPYNLDLSHRDEINVEGYELPDKWGIKPEMYL
jgi:HD-GYP domain-containing protein (c-di-GMP phosphodiesterase class II)